MAADKNSTPADIIRVHDAWLAAFNVGEVEKIKEINFLYVMQNIIGALDLLPTRSHSQWLDMDGLIGVDGGQELPLDFEFGIDCEKRC